jgi:diguanylate cyclase (GGDEF)-like protein
MHAMLSGINATIIRVRSQDQLLNEMCRLAVDTGGFRNVVIRLLDESGATLIPVVAVAQSAKPMQVEELSTSGSVTVGRAFLERCTHICNDLLDESVSERARQRALGMGLRSSISVPLLIDDAVVGVLTLVSSEQNFFDDDEVRLVEQLAGDASFALDTLRKGEQLYHLAVHDPLTGLANRDMLHEQINAKLSSLRERGTGLAVVVLNLRRFRSVNESLGLHVGDQLLKQMAARLLEAHGRERIARIGADLFAAILDDVHDAADAARSVVALRERLAPPYELAGRELHVDTRAGVALYPSDGSTAETLTVNAEAALRRSDSVDEPVIFYKSELNAQVADRLDLENRLRRALAENQFVLHYQPKIHAATRRIIGAEALIRWRDPGEGLIAPARFIPVLEETGLIVEVGAWALREAAAMHARIGARGIYCPRIAVNVSQVQMRRREFTREVIDAVGAAGQSKTADGTGAHGVDLEITESLLMDNLEDAVRKLGELREAGFMVSIDDFGTGYSSLSYLSVLPVHALKIDRSFVNTMTEGADRMAIVSTIINLAHSFQLKVIAEGVELDDQFRLLQLLRCDEVQGFLFHRPLPEDEFAAVLSTNPKQ